MVFLLFLLTIFLFRFSHVSTAVAAESGLLHNPDLIFKIIKPFSPLKDSLAILKKKFSMRRLICSSSAGKCRAILSYEGDPRAQLLIGSKNGMVDFINLSIVVKNDILEQMDDYSFGVSEFYDGFRIRSPLSRSGPGVLMYPLRG